jgi:hypothetical protein
MPWNDVTFDLAFANGAVLLAGVVLYALLGGADFGGGIWDLLARGPRADRQRQEIARAIGPIWEANHVWLIFSIVVAFTVFPKVFAIVSVALYIPLSLALLGIVLRGAAFVFRAYAHDVTRAQQGWGAVFAIASTATPVMLGTCAGAVASGEIRVVDGEFRGSYWTTWLSPFPIVIGLLSLATCAYLAAVYMTVETRRKGELGEDFRRRALGAGAAFTILSLIALPLARSEGLDRRAARDGVGGDQRLGGLVAALFDRPGRSGRRGGGSDRWLGDGAISVPGGARSDLREHGRVGRDAAGVLGHLRARIAGANPLARPALRPVQGREPGHHRRVRRLDQRAALVGFWVLGRSVADTGCPPAAVGELLAAPPVSCSTDAGLAHRTTFLAAVRRLAAR